MLLMLFWAALQSAIALPDVHHGLVLLDLRCSAGPMPDSRMPTVLASTRLTEVRGFSDFCSEFFQVGHRGNFNFASAFLLCAVALKETSCLLRCLM